MPQHDRNIDTNSASPATQQRQSADVTASADGRPRSVIEQQINENLRRIYQEKLQEEVPEHLRILLQKLKEQDRLK